MTGRRVTRRTADGVGGMSPLPALRRDCGRVMARRSSRLLSVLSRPLLACSDARTPLVLYSPHGRDQLTLLEHAFEATHPGHRRALARHGLAGDPRPAAVRARQPAGRRLVRRPDHDLRPRGAPTRCSRRTVRPGPAHVGPRGHRPERPVLSRVPHAGGHRLQQPRSCARIRRPRLGRRARAALVRQGAHPRSDGQRHHAGHLGPDHRAQPPRAPATRPAGWRGSAASTARPRRTPSTPRSSTRRLARGEGLVTLWDLPDMLISRSKGMPFDYVFPRSGTVVIDDAIGLVRGSRHPAAARAFIDFVGSEEGQLLAADQGVPAARAPRPAAASGCPRGWRRSSARWSSPTWTGTGWRERARPG